nr:hypothetical protein GCM10020093_119500 [Planobispora longispora]
MTFFMVGVMRSPPPMTLEWSWAFSVAVVAEVPFAAEVPVAPGVVPEVVAVPDVPAVGVDGGAEVVRRRPPSAVRR